MKKEIYFYSYSGGMSKGVDAVIARKYIRDGWVPAPRTVIKGCQKIISRQLSKASVVMKDIPLALKETLVFAMGQLKGKRRTVMFSGGFDSILMVLLARNYGATVNALTIQFEDFNLMTVKDAVQLAQKLDISHSILRVSFSEFISSFQVAAKITHEPLLDLDLALVHAAFKKYRSKISKQVFISGMGSDQWLGNIALEPEYGSLQQRFDMTMQYSSAHHQIAKLFGHQFIFPYLSSSIVALSMSMSRPMKKNKKILRALAAGFNLESVDSRHRELQIPESVRRLLVKAYAHRAWPEPLDKEKQRRSDDQTLRQIVLGLWLEGVQNRLKAYE